MVERPSSWYLDLNLLARYVNDGLRRGGCTTTPRPWRWWRHCTPVWGVCSTRAWRRGGSATPNAASSLQDGLVELGLELLVRPDHRLPQLTTVNVPPGVDEAAVRRELLQTYGIEIGAGAGQLAGRVWRIGCMGHTARRRNVLALLGALSEVLGR